jgi:hypothetical protein
MMWTQTSRCWCSRYRYYLKFPIIGADYVAFPSPVNVIMLEMGSISDDYILVSHGFSVLGELIYVRHRFWPYRCQLPHSVTQFPGIVSKHPEISDAVCIAGSVVWARDPPRPLFFREYSYRLKVRPNPCSELRVMIYKIDSSI